MSRPSHRVPRRLANAALATMAIALLGTACAADPTWIPNDEYVAAPASKIVEPVTAEDPPEQLAFIEEPSTSPALCTAVGNIWIQFEALELAHEAATPELTRIAFLRITERVDRAVLLDDDGVLDLDAIGITVEEVTQTLEEEFDGNWNDFQSSVAYGASSAARDFQTHHADLAAFADDNCANVSADELATSANAEALGLISQFGSEPSTVTPSESFPGTSIFTHASGRLIASFPTLWDHQEIESHALIDLAAAKDMDKFLDGQATEAVRIQLVSAGSLSDFGDLLLKTAPAGGCFLVDEVREPGDTELMVTQSFDCADHAASVIASFREGDELGLIIEAAFDRVDPTKADLQRLVAISTSVLWS